MVVSLQPGVRQVLSRQLLIPWRQMNSSMASMQWISNRISDECNCNRINKWKDSNSSRTDSNCSRITYSDPWNDRWRICNLTSMNSSLTTNLQHNNNILNKLHQMHRILIFPHRGRMLMKVQLLRLLLMLGKMWRRRINNWLLINLKILLILI